MIKYFLLIVLFSGTSFAQQNLKENFEPLKSSGTLSDIFTQNIRNVIKDEIAELDKQEDKDKLIKKTYLTETNYEIEKIVKSGNTLINDEITNYLNKVVDVVLKNNQTLRNELHVYTLKSPVVNAYSYDKGYVFINIGLIAQAETEAQLAYILSHEISHYIKKHHINGYVDTKKKERNGYDRKSKTDILIEKCQYSKEKESEADVEGFKLFEQTNYNLKQAEKSFDVLQYAHLPFELVEFKKSFFETENYIIPNRYFLKEVSSIRNNSNEDDTKHTHPNTAKRKVSIAELIRNRDNSKRVNYIVSKEEFEYIRDLARMELCRLYLKRRDYPNALYAAYILSHKYPQNQYLTEVISKSLYAITLYQKGIIQYNSDSYLEGGFPSYSDIESYPQQLYCLINRMPKNEWAIMSLNYVFRAHQKYPANKKLGAYSDSLFKLMGQTNWGIPDFVRVKKKPGTEKDSVAIDSLKSIDDEKSKTDLIANLQQENNFKLTDTVYYKEIYTDLFINDPEFASKFPAPNSTTSASNTDFSNYILKSHRDSDDSEIDESKKTKVKVDKVLLLEPLYLKVDDKHHEGYKYTESDEKQEEFIVTVNEYAKRFKFAMVTLDPGLLTSAEVDKMNDYSVINDWFVEKLDADEEDKSPILNTDEIDEIIEKYGTQYVMRIGVVNYIPENGSRMTYYYSYVYDIKNNDIVHKRNVTYKGKDNANYVSTKVYETLYELKHPK
ncbi:MAG: hypothetical protein C0448_11740 [Sphingobacteriaceae bacterium]|nr:hypothetical protein [Sphingobacteriaceae bacterium]